MRKIFDLFLFLLSIWFLLMLGSMKMSVEFAIAGFVSAALVAILSFLLGIINDQSKFIFLSLRFYAHFISCYFTNFGRSLNLIFQLALGTKSTHPVCEDIKILEKYNPDQALLIASINMICGLMVVGIGETIPNLIEDLKLLSNRNPADELEFTSSKATQLEAKFNDKLNLNRYSLKIYAVDEDCLTYLNLLKTSICLQEINDDDLV